MNTRAVRATPYLLLAPFLGVFAVFLAYPLVRSALLATERSFGPAASEPVGLENFALLLRDPVFWTAARNTLVFTAGSVLVQLPLALLLALALNRPALRGRALYRLVFFCPQLVGLVFSGIIASLMFEKKTGLINRALHGAVGLDLDFPWLQVHVMPMLIVTALWMYTGFNMVYFLAALQNVDRSLTEAARIDGAGPAQRFFHVTLPAIRPVASFVVLLSIIGSVQLFELPFVIFALTDYGGAGPENRALTLVWYLYQQGFEAGDLGYASAIGWMIAIVLFVTGLSQVAIMGRGETR
jgi:ABC-type sugar transport system permease subunit